MKTNRSILMLVAAVAFTACDKNAVQLDELFEPADGQAQVKFFHFGVNGPGVNFYLNDGKVTALSSATGVESTNGTTYSGVGVGGLYTAQEPGQATVSGRIAAAADKNLPISNLSTTLESDKSYSYYLSGFYNTTTKSQDSFIVEDVLPAFNYDQTCVRFVNAISNSQPMALFVKDPTTGAETTIGGAAAYKSGGTFVCFTGGTYDIFARTAGSTVNAISRTAVGFAQGRVYTIAARGDMTVTSTTATNRPFLDNTANR